MIGYIYLTTNLINNHKYIGKRQKSKFDESYKGSGKRLQAAIKKYGWENFSCEILKWCETIEELNQSEKYFIQYYDAVNSSDYYNLAKGGDGGDTGVNYKGMAPRKAHHSEETKKKMSEQRLGHLTSIETRDKISKSNSGKKRTIEQRLANKIRNTGKIWIRKCDIQKTIRPEDLEKYLEEGWEKGRLKNKKPAWNKGLNKDTDSRLLKISENRKALHEERGAIGCFGLKGSENKNYKHKD